MCCRFVYSGEIHTGRTIEALLAIVEPDAHSLDFLLIAEVNFHSEVDFGRLDYGEI